MTNEVKILSDAEAMYGQLTDVYPRDPRFLRKYADILSKLGKSSQAEQAWERLHALLIGSGDASAVQALEKEHPFLAADHSSLQPSEAGFLSFLDDGLMNRMMMRVKERKLKENEYLFHAGDEGHAMYVVVEGQLTVLGQPQDNGKPTVLNVLGRGDIVGEAGMLHQSPRSADVVAAVPSRVIKIQRNVLLEILAQSPKIEASFQKESNIRHRVTQISRNKLLARLPLKERRRLADIAKPYRTACQSRLCEGGRLIQDVRLLTKGVADVIYENHRGESHWLHDVQAGDMIGESAILGEAKYPIDVVAATDVEWLSLPLPVLQDIAGAYPGMRLQLEKLVETQITKAMQLVQRVKKVRELD